MVGIVGAAGIAGGLWASGKLSSSATSSQSAATSSSSTNEIVKELRASAAQRSVEIKTLQDEVAGLKAGNAVVNQVLMLAGQAVQQLEAQMSELCAATNGCVVQHFIIPPATPTTTTPAP